MRERVDLVHSLASTAPTWGRFRRVVTVHDLIYERFPEAHAGLRDKGMGVLVPLGVRRSQIVIAISQNTRDDLIDLHRTPSEKIAVVPQGIGSPPRPERSVDPQEMRERFSIGRRAVLLSLSAKRPHKNLRVLLGALALIPTERRPLLLLAGYPTDHERELRKLARTLDLERDVRFPGWLNTDEVEALWQIASAFVYPSLYEGFGLPVLEAMARGVPVACANTSSLPEVAGDAAILFDPHGERSVAEALHRVLDDAPLRERLRKDGLEQSSRFTWERTARGTLKAYEAALARR
jgi:glycosyltransferase involved in cell wall biosynthesis